MSRNRAVRRTLPLLLLAALPGTAAAQSAADIIEQSREAFERRASGVENYTLVQRVLGNETTTYFVREQIDGITIFRPRQSSDLPGAAPAADGGMDPVFFFRPEVAQRMTYEGRDEVDGNACHVVALDDFEGLGLDEIMPDADDFSMKHMRLCVDTDEHVVRRMVMTGTTSAMGQPRDITTNVVLQDYRDVEGMLHPFRMEMTTSGMAMGGDQAAMSEAMARMEEQLEKLPEAQREQMREMMKSRMQGMEGMMDAVAGKPIVVEVVDLRVNEGPPTGGR